MPNLILEGKKGNNLLHDLSTKPNGAFISQVNRADKLVWQFTKNGFHLVRSAFYLHQQLKGSNRCNNSKGDTNRHIWNIIWKLNILNGIKVFIWQACKDTLPTLKNLASKKVSKTTLCPICGLVEGIVGHTLWLCPTAQDVWCQTLVKFQKISSNSSFFADIWKQLIEKLNCMEHNEVVYILKYIWFRRNTYIHQRTFTHPNNLLHKAKEEFS